MISFVACCHGAKFCAYAARDFRSQQCHRCILYMNEISKVKGFTFSLDKVSGLGF